MSQGTSVYLGQGRKTAMTNSFVFILKILRCFPIEFIIHNNFTWELQDTWNSTVVPGL